MFLDEYQDDDEAEAEFGSGLAEDDALDEEQDVYVPTPKHRKVTPRARSSAAAVAAHGPSGSDACLYCKKKPSRFAEMARVWERKLDELPLEQALGIEKKMSDMLFEAMITNLQTQKALAGNK